MEEILSLPHSRLFWVTTNTTLKTEIGIGGGSVYQLE